MASCQQKIPRQDTHLFVGCTRWLGAEERRGRRRRGRRARREGGCSRKLQAFCRAKYRAKRPTENLTEFLKGPLLIITRATERPSPLRCTHTHTHTRALGNSVPQSTHTQPCGLQFINIIFPYNRVHAN